MRLLLLLIVVMTNQLLFDRLANPSQCEREHKQGAEDAIS